ncbi:unnamed protein product [Mytilus coruscus]|uniref:CCHC-type domain-containing protein n=1 Tax=Mytilus coruscus TaxID=42192 RepID=A0A6J8EI86_MYTCO|nr:unnamed protein product [Mytilus coruscus]
MSEPAEINMLIDRKIKDAMSQNQNEILQNIDRLMSSRLDTFQRSVHETQMSKIQQMNTENYVFKGKGNEEQFKVNTKIANKMKEARSLLTETQDNNESTEGAMRNICEGLDILNHRQKLIKLADQSENGWRTVTEYETHSLADDSGDEKRIIRAENKASRKMKSDKKFKTRTTPYSAPQSTRFSSVNQQSTVNISVVNRPGKCYECGLSGHWRSDHYKQGWQTQKEKSDKISTRLCSNDLSVNFCRENAIVSCNSPVGKGEIHVSARFLASIIVQIISTQGAVGLVVRLRTRSMYECILYKASWNANVLLNSRSLDEIVFWKENIEKMNGRELHIVEQYSSVVYTDASGIGYGGYW